MSELSYTPEKKLPSSHSLARMSHELGNADTLSESVEQETAEILETLIQDVLVHYDNGQNFEAAKSFASGLIHANIIKPRYYGHVVSQIEHNSRHETRDVFIASLKQIAANNFFKGNGLPLQPLSML